MAVGSSMLATMRTEPPQWPHVLTSMLKTRLRRCAQVIERRFSSGLRWSLLAAVDSSSVGGRLPRPDGVIRAGSLPTGQTSCMAALPVASRSLLAVGLDVSLICVRYSSTQALQHPVARHTSPAQPLK